MSLEDLEIKESWRSPRDDIVEDFFVPVLNESVEYRRVTGFFHSKCLVALSSGMLNFLKKGGKMKLISWVYLTKTDFEAVEKGLESRGKLLEKWEESVMNDLESATD